MAAERVPERVRWAVEQLDLRPGDEVLEIGCGPGVAVSLVCDRLTGGHVVGIDRSATAIRRATARNGEHLAAGTARLLQTELADLELPAGSIDVAVAVNVNLFWVRSPTTELRVVGGLLRDGGRLVLCYEVPDASRTASIAAKVVAALEAGGFSTGVTHGPGALLSVRATLTTGQR
jgi:SAM-dependent methyltransferase